MDRSMKVGVCFTKIGENVAHFDAENNCIKVKRNKDLCWVIPANHTKSVLSVERQFPKHGLATTIGFSVM
eukprot:TRINITY_DN5453_c0_g1_i1.p1 TRINITY_DN5453_c0_g1~~TRINITY_DN5453_c0_g1_i1.p1  ORF type:complete len:70 (+),score=4.12 TRINITY_DN5453_c0_g1_i1:113-322(+)